MAKCINPHQITPLKSAVCVSALFAEIYLSQIFRKYWPSDLEVPRSSHTRP